MSYSTKYLLFLSLFIYSTSQLQRSSDYEVWDGSQHPVENLTLQPSINIIPTSNQVSSFFPNQYLNVNLDSHVNQAFNFNAKDLDLKNQNICTSQLYIEQIQKVQSQQTVLIQLLFQNQEKWEASSQAKEIIRKLNTQNVKLNQILNEIQQEAQTSSVYNNSNNIKCNNDQQKQQYQLLQQLLDLKRKQETSNLQLIQKDQQIQNLIAKNQEKEQQLQNYKNIQSEKETLNQQLEIKLQNQSQQTVENCQKQNQQLEQELKESEQRQQNCLATQSQLQQQFESQVKQQQQAFKENMDEKSQQIRSIQEANAELTEQYQICMNKNQKSTQDQQSNTQTQKVDKNIQQQNQLEQQQSGNNQQKDLKNLDIQEVYEIILAKLLQKQTDIGDSDLVEIQGLLFMLIQKIQECSYRLQAQDNLTINIHQSNLLERLDYLNDQISRQEVIISSLQQRNQELQSINVELSQNNMNEMRIEMKYKQQILDLQEQADIALRQCKMLELSNDLINKANDELILQNENMQNQVKQLQNQRQELQSKNSSLSQQLSVNNNKNLQQQKLISTLNIENQGLNIDYQNVNLNKQQLQKQIEQIDMVLQKDECLKAAELRDFFAIKLSVITDTMNGN